jgi:hypothetical protein
VLGYEAFSRPDLLPAFRRSIHVGAVTSYDRTEGNDDGFSGKYSFVRKEGDTLVLADLKGPGVITRIHTPTPTDEPLEFYFDGEPTPRLVLPYRQLFTGGTPPFLKPLVGYAGGGAYSYVPIPYKKSCKVVLRAKSTQFYDLDYATYPGDAPIESYSPKESAKTRADRERAQKVLASRDLTPFNVASGTKLTRQRFDTLLAPGKSVTLVDAKRGGRIAALRIGPTASLAGKGRDVLLRVTWDGEKTPSILVPASDFFGYAWGQPQMSSAYVGSRDDAGYCYFPMPFDRSAKIELVSLRKGGAPLPIRGEIVLGDTPRQPYEGRFYAVWRRENPTTTGKPYTYLDTQGKGHLVGLALQAQGLESGNTFFFEGDDISTIDGEMTIHGTGSEDFFNGGWYDVPGRWDAPFSLPLSGSLAYQRYLGRTGGYRFMIGDAYAFDRSLRQTMEHGPTGNAHPTDYASVAYLYSDRHPASATAPTLASLRVRDPEKIIFSAHWTMPIEAFSLSGSTLTRGDVKVGDRNVRVLSLRAQRLGDFDQCFVSLRADLPSAGRYKVYLDAVKGPANGQVQLFQRELAVGKPVDLYSPEATEANGLYLGEIDAKEGGNVLMFNVVGKNAAASGMGLDLVNVVCVRA